MTFIVAAVLAVLWTATPSKRARAVTKRTTPATSTVGRSAVTLPPGRAGFTPREVAEMLAISLAYVYVLMDRGELVSFHLGRARRITGDSLADLIARRIAAEDQSA
jgi:excisionase family DNA binding protein